jgi:hypothetical protein
LSKLNHEQIVLLEERKDKLISGFISLMNERKEEPSFEAAISYGTGNLNKVKRRFSAVEKLIKEVLE